MSAADGFRADVGAEVRYWRERAELAEAGLARSQEQIAELTQKVAVLARMVFGRSSEKADPAGERQQSPDQGDPGPGGGVGGEAVALLEEKRRRGQQRGGKGHGRRDYSRLRTREEVHDVPDDGRLCGCCGRPLQVLGSECSEQIDWQVEVTRIVHRRLRYRRGCDCPPSQAGPRTVTAPPAPNPTGKGRFSAAFLARLLYSKYVLGLPVHRIVRMLAAEGLDVPAGTLAGVLKTVAGLLEPVREAIIARNAAAVHVHIDETSWRVFEKTDGKDGHRWWLWVFIAGDTVVFRMDPTRSTSVLETHFGVSRDDERLPPGRRLLLSTDFFTAYQCLARVEGVDPLWCWAHIRRYFIRAGDGDPQLRFWRDQWVTRIGDLYLAHRALAAATPGTSDHNEAGEAFEQTLTLMDTVRREQMRSPGLRPAGKKVLATLDREWEGLARHREFPDIDLDNNRAERALRTPVVGRKNYYGSHAEWSAHLAATVWTLTATAERNGHEPLTYLVDYLTACAENRGTPPQGPALNRFLPWNHTPKNQPDHDNPTGSGPSP